MRHHTQHPGRNSAALMVAQYSQRAGLWAWHPKAEHQKVKAIFENTNCEASLDVPALPDTEMVERYFHYMAHYWDSYLQSTLKMLKPQARLLSGLSQSNKLPCNNYSSWKSYFLCKFAAYPQKFTFSTPLIPRIKTKLEHKFSNYHKAK